MELPFLAPGSWTLANLVAVVIVPIVVAAAAGTIMGGPSLTARAQSLITRAMYGKEPAVAASSSFFGLKDRLIDGAEVTMDKYKGHVLCVVNVASKCAFTKRDYTQLVRLTDEYGSRGFKVLAFPCNQFGGQEPGTPEEILKFVEQFDARDKLTFFEKADVNGENTRPVFGYLKEKLPFEDGSTNIMWNFGKFLVGPDGTPHSRYGSKTEPNEMRTSIEELLKLKEKEQSSS